MKEKMRFERKYLLDEDSAFLLKQRVSAVLAPDAHAPGGHYRVHSLYFDDQYNSAFHEKQNGVLRRDKFRARFYDGNMEPLRLELKHKHGEMVRKEAFPLTSEQYRMMLRGDYAFMRDTDSPVARQFYTTHLLKRLRPVVMVEYQRQAFTQRTGNVRITFDSELVAKAPAAEHGFSVRPGADTIMEIKYDHFLPASVEGLFSGLPFTQQLPLSKFCMAVLVMRGR